MLINKIYVVSWFGKRENKKLRERRKEMHQKQVDWAKRHQFEIIVYAQDYDDDEYLDGVTYIKHRGDVIPPGHARNFLLKHFYNTQDDFAIFADNDTVLYELPQHKDSQDFIERLQKLDIKDFAHVGLITPLNPARLAFNKDVLKKSYDEAYTFRRTSSVKGSLMIIKNIKKHLNKQPLFDEKIFVVRDGELLPGEDCDFAYTLWKMGQGAYTTIHAILNEFGRNHSTWADDDHRRYEQHLEFFVPAMNEKHGQIFVTGVDGNDLEKGFSFYGISTHPNTGPKLRFARCKKDRLDNLTRAGHTDIEFHPLPEPMQIPEMLPYLETTDLYATNPAFREGVDKMSGKGRGTGKNPHFMKLKTFTNWTSLDPHDLPRIITIPKT